MNAEINDRNTEIYDMKQIGFVFYINSIGYTNQFPINYQI
jgi:hypothetical protein